MPRLDGAFFMLDSWLSDYRQAQGATVTMAVARMLIATKAVGTKRAMRYLLL